MKQFKFHNANITMERKGYGQYIITGMGKSIHCTSSHCDSFIWFAETYIKDFHVSAIPENVVEQ